MNPMFEKNLVKQNKLHGKFNDIVANSLIKQEDV